jgi:hypothetical protein
MNEDRIADYLAVSEDEMALDLDAPDYDEEADAADFQRLLNE